MLIHSRHPRPKPAIDTKKHVPRAAKAKRRPKPRSQHLDYDRKPLAVDGLSHYIDPITSDERFRVH